MYQVYQPRASIMSSAGFLSRFNLHLKKAIMNSKLSKSARNITNPPQITFGKGCLLKPTIFTLCFSTVSFGAATIWQYENMRKRAQEIFQSPKWFSRNKAKKKGEWRKIFNVYWNTRTEAEKIFYGILFLNLVVFGCWRTPSLKPFMNKHFLTKLEASRPACMPLILYGFSHFSIIHLAVNMYALKSFMPSIVNDLGKEQFLAFYLASAVISGYTSLLYKFIIKSPNSSLGASGAIMAIVSYACFKNPESQLGFVFLPNFQFDAVKGLYSLIIFDLICCLAKFRIMDHACHLGGAFFGAFWCFYGFQYIWLQRGPLLEFWHKLRSPPTSS